MQFDLFPHLVPPDEPPITQACALEVLRPVIPELFEICGDALAETNRCTAGSAARGVVDSGLTRTLKLHDGIASFARQRWGEHAHFHLVERKPFSVVMRSVLSVTFKKLCRGRLEFNETEATIARVRQCEDLPQIIVGVSLSPAEDRVSSLHVFCMRDEHAWWWREIVPEPEAPAVPSAASAGSPAASSNKARKFRGKKNGERKTKRDRDQES